jgi:hypothetical protein
MKHLLVILITICSFGTANAQLFSKERIQNNENFDKKFLTWGYFLGFNSYDFNFDYYDEQTDIFVQRSTGFNVGLIGDMRINDHFNLRLEPGLIINTRELIYNTDNFLGVPDLQEQDLLREIKSTYVHFPLLLKISTKRVNNLKPFIVVGLSTAINLSSNEKNPDDNSKGQFRLKRSMNFYEVGLGVDFYLYWFKFTPSIRGVFALNNELVRDEDPNSAWTGNIDSMKTRGLFINFTFQ